MTLRLLGIGFGRTGTLSTKLALERLGWGPCLHMQDIRSDPALLPPWVVAARGERMNWQEVFQGYASEIDWPGTRYWRELIETFPKAKVVLTVRDAEDWWASMSRTIVLSAKIGRQADPNPHTRAVAEMVFETVHQQVFGGRIEDKDHAIDVYRQHNRDVIAAVPKDRLLVYDVKDGWAPLCAFLGETIPTDPFPHKNTREEFISKRDFLGGQ